MLYVDEEDGGGHGSYGGDYGAVVGRNGNDVVGVSRGEEEEVFE